MRRRLLPLILILLLTTSGCRVPGSTQPVVKIGLAAPFEGLYRSLGYDALYGVKLAVRERNATGGVGGTMVELMALDDHFDPVRAASVAREMDVDPDVIGVIGPLSSAMALAAQEGYQRAELAFVTLATADTLDTDGAFRLSARDADLGAFAASYVVNELGAPRVAILRQTEDGPADAFVWAAKDLGAEVVWDGQAVENWLADLRNAAPQVIFVTGDSLAGADAARLVREADITATLIGGQGWATPHLVSIGGEAVEGVLYVTAAPAPADLDASDFVANYQALAGFPPGPYGVWAYDAARALLTALDSAIRADGHPTRGGVMAQLTSLTDCHGLNGPITFDARRGRLNPPLYVYRIESGSYPGRLVWRGTAQVTVDEE
jgi:branched-chain amino acid transport system substrate-binding protein